MKYCLAFLLVLSFTGSVCCAAEQMQLSDDVSVRELAQGVWLHTTYHRFPGAGRFPCNGLIVVDGGEAWLVDLPCTDKQTAFLCDWIADKQQARLLGAVPTHWHIDCVGGLAEVHRRGATSHALNQTIAILKQKNQALPRQGFGRRKTLKCGRLSLELKFYGAGHSMDNIVVWIPERKVLFGGCLIKSAGSRNLGFTADGDLNAYPHTLKALRASVPEGAVVIPGHGLPGGVKLIDFTLGLCPKPSAASSINSRDGLIASSEPDWPQWRGPRRDGHARESGLLTEWPESGPKLLWQIDGLGRGWSSPIIVGDRLYITGDKNPDLSIYAYDLNGQPVWQTENGRIWKNPYPGARASCTYAAGRLYHLNAHGRLVCLEAASGKEVWTVNILERFAGKNITWALSESVLIDGDHVIVTPGGAKAMMAALDKETGATRWTTPRTDAMAEDKASHCTPILFRFQGRRILASCSSAHGFGVDADTGKLLWTVPLRNPHGVNASTPVYHDGLIFYATPYAERGRCYRLQSKGDAIVAEQIWSHDVDPVTGGGLLVDNTLYAAGYRKPKWWFAVDWTTGRTKVELKELVTGALVYADQRLYCLDERGNVALLDPNDGGLKLISRFSLDLPTSKKIKDAWAHPVVFEGRLYLRYHDKLWCYDIKH